MGLVRFALKFRVTFYVLAVLIVLIVLAGGGAAIVMPKDVLPDVEHPGGDHASGPIPASTAPDDAEPGHVL